MQISGIRCGRPQDGECGVGPDAAPSGCGLGMSVAERHISSSYSDRRNRMTSPSLCHRLSCGVSLATSHLVSVRTFPSRLIPTYTLAVSSVLSDLAQCRAQNLGAAVLGLGLSPDHLTEPQPRTSALRRPSGRARVRPSPRASSGASEAPECSLPSLDD